MGRFSLKVTNDSHVKRFMELLCHNDIAENLIKDIELVKNNIDVIKTPLYYCSILSNENNDIGIGAIRIFKKINKACIDVGILKKYRGKDAYKACKEGLENFFMEYPDIELYSFVKKNNKPSLLFSNKLGLKIYNKAFGHYLLRLKNV